MSEAVRGPVFLRERPPFTAACQTNEGHAHTFDHTTMCVRGRIQITARWEEGGQPVEKDLGEFGFLGTCVIKAGVFHTIKALTDDAAYVCIYSHRDTDGVLVERYGTGIPHARAYV